MLGKYYRVGFYGYRFEDLNGKEFVYKEPKSTHLFELKDRLNVSQGFFQGPPKPYFFNFLILVGGISKVLL